MEELWALTAPEHRPGPLIRLSAAVLPGVRRVLDQIPERRAAWTARNADVLAADERPRWLVLGDSTAQGIGADDLAGSYIGQLSERLGHAYGIVNLSVTGARVRDVLTDQLPRARVLGLQPALVTCSVGSNDLLRGITGRFAREYAQLCDELAGWGADVVVSSVPAAAVSLSARYVNCVIARRADACGLVVADVNRHYRPPYRRKVAADRFHPNERGYRDWADAFAEALAPQTRPRAASSR